MVYPPITARQLALARFSLDLLMMRPERVETFLTEMNMRPETEAAIRRGLERPVEFRQWAQAVVDRWRKEQQ